MRAEPLAPVKVETDVIPLRGGLDLHTPQTQLRPGYCRSAQNFEVSINGGYSRINGYERFDGRPSPTAAVYTTLTVSATAGIAVGDTVNGQTSGATGVVAYIDATPLTVVLTKLTGTFTVAENLRKVATVIGSISVVGVPITDQLLLATYQLAASNIYRADIGVVPGSGSVLGVWSFNGTVYAARNNAGATAAALYKQSGSGWTVVPFSYEIAFQTGSVAPTINGTITKGTVSAVVRRIVLESGGWSTNDAKGRFICDAPTGGAFTAGALTAGGTATLYTGLTGGLVQNLITWLPGGRFETHIGNAGNATMLYGCDGVNRGFEFDGTYIVPINTGQPIDAPTHVRVHKKHVFFSFKGSAQYSGAGNPFGWTALTGSAEIAVDESITCFATLPGTLTAATLAIYTSNTISILYGTGPSDWNLVSFASPVGAKPYTSESLGDSYTLGDNGVQALKAVKEFGNFSGTSITANIRSFVQARKTLATEATINREKSQYRIFFSDGYGLYITIVNGNVLGAMPVFFPDPVLMASSGDSNNNGNELSYFGTTTGYVMCLDVGTSFDGAAIDYNFDLAFNSEGNARVLKRYRKAVMEVQGAGYAQFNGGWSYAYGDQDIVAQQLATKVSGVYWDQFTWDQFTWDGSAVAPNELSIEGSAENLSMSISGSSALWPSFTINAITLHFTRRRLLR